MAADHGPSAGRLSVGLGVRAPGADDVVLNLGDRHPSSHGALRLRLRLEGDHIVSCDPVVGFVHRGVEKLFEVRDYRQIVLLANRHDWHSAFSSELGVVLAVERMLGLEVPERATWARTLLAELNRALNHLFFLGAAPVGPGSRELLRRTHARSSSLQLVLEEASGGRVHYMFNRVGGLKEDLPAGWLSRVATAVHGVRTALPAWRDAVLGESSDVARARGLGVLTAPVVDAYGVSGPLARASGVDLDLRRDDPYLAYADLAGAGLLAVPTRQAGDVVARFEVLLDQLATSLDLVDACVDRLRSLRPGPVNVRLPKAVRPPEGLTYVWTENPMGVNGYHLVSRGEPTPWRLKLRSASFNNVAALPHAVDGCRVGDLVAILASLFFVLGDVDK